MDWQGVLKKPVDDAIDDLEEITEDYSLSEGDWDSVDDASDYLFEHKVKKRDIFDDLEDTAVHSFSGPHPAGNVGIHIHHIDPISSKNDTVWYLSPQDVSKIGKVLIFFSESNQKQKKVYFVI